MQNETEIEKQAREEHERHQTIDTAVEGWTPTGDHLILATIRATEKRVGSIVVPGADSPMGSKIDRRGRLARVVACGPEAKDISVNMRVFAPTYAGAVIDLEGQALIVIRASELLLVADSHGGLIASEQGIRELVRRVGDSVIDELKERKGA